MRASEIADAVGMKVTTLNAWMSRGVFQNIAPSGRGNAREFDQELATRIALVGELGRLGIGSEDAAKLAKEHNDERFMVLIPDYEKTRHLRALPKVFWCKDETDLGGLLAAAGLPVVSYTVVDIDRLVEMLKRKGKGGKGC